jgi:hypothetical protein
MSTNATQISLQADDRDLAYYMLGKRNVQLFDVDTVSRFKVRTGRLHLLSSDQTTQHGLQPCSDLPSWGPVYLIVISDSQDDL